MSATAYGFIGLGNMGGPMAANLAAKGLRPVVFDAAGSAERAPAESRPVEALADLVTTAATVFLSLPDGAAVRSVAEGIAESGPGAVEVVVDLSTIGVEQAASVAARLKSVGIVYVDAPVSGGRAGAAAGTITIMWAGPADLIERHADALGAMAGNIFHVGDRPGQGQAMKLLNNFLSATAMAATAEAITFGLSQGLDPATMLRVLNVSTGRNTATSDKFPNRILTGTYDAGFHTALMAKDVALYLQCVAAAAAPSAVGAAVGDLWRAADEALPGSDFTRIFDFVRDPQKAAGADRRMPG